ncbi:HD-GYP domain-containing protein [Alkalicoccus chagannorensis]|uniref:HD-GYP domain-containing protein n=1 Tax=Alkalicoccus chagannorensis TaxID=427072 RepID=UPI0004010914|nr:HD domain-containing phosphohydrolase [Alkalicoccus chagannorensis]
MIYKAVKNLEQGQKLGKSIFAEDGRILLNKGVTLTIGMLTKLRSMGVTAVFIEDGAFDDIVMEEVVSDTTKRQTMKSVANAVQYIQQDKPINGQEIGGAVDMIIEEVLGSSDVLYNMTDIRTEDNELFVHLTQVCILSTLIGVQLRISRERVKDLAVGALLHDAGKVIHSGAQRNLPAGYKGDEEELQHHAWKGFNLLRRSADISTLSAHIALAHHEAVDGSGSPRGMKGDDIHALAKIVAVTNEYDRLVSGHREETMFPHEACEYIMSRTNSKYDHHIVWQFLRCVAFYPNGTQVRLSDGRIGVVTGQHKGLPQRPIVRCYESDENASFQEVDLAEATTTFISRVFD